eukprot:135840-Amphidinium_carterae.1
MLECLPGAGVSDCLEVLVDACGQSAMTCLLPHLLCQCQGVRLRTGSDTPGVAIEDVAAAGA